ncbi:MAG: acetoacetyl-CoA reductase [Alphaproteobacteria bacterium]|nr:acetoacetyl-CoA reductase [Alphaproteobacteria bacterium]
MARVAVVTGGTRGIGLAITRELKEAGFRVAATYQGNEEAAEACRRDMACLALKWDCGNLKACEDGIAQIEAELGPVDTLVNNAGITWDTMLHKMTEEQWHSVIRTDLDSIFYMTRAVLNGMRERSFGRIINITSINGQKGQMGQTNYSAAKSGMIGFTKALAQETARRGITVNCVAPGYIDTDMVAKVPPDVLAKIVDTIPVGRLGKPEEIAWCVRFLADERSAFITGATLTVNGAQYITG